MVLLLHDEVREVGCTYAGFGKKTVDSLRNFIAQLKLTLRSSNRCRILTGQQHKYRVAGKEKLAAGKHTLKVDVKYNGPGMGKTATATLFVDGQQVAQSTIERTIPVRFSLDETLDVAEDTGTPVVEDYVNKMPFKFTGTLKKVVIELGKSGLGLNDEKKLNDLSQKAARAVE